MLTIVIIIALIALVALATGLAVGWWARGNASWCENCGNPKACTECPRPVAGRMRPARAAHQPHA